MFKSLGLFLLFLAPFIWGSAQNIEDDYQFVVSLDTKMQRKLSANELMLDANESYLIVNYGNRPSYIIVYDRQNFEAKANFRLSDWVEFSGAYMDNETNQLYVKESRYSSEYYRLDINTGEQDIVACHLTPRGCPNDDPKKSIKSLFSLSKDFYVAINKRNTRDVRVYKLKK